MSNSKTRVLVNGYGVIGKRVADAVAAQDDMQLVGIADVVSDWRIKVAIEKGYPVFASTSEAVDGMRAARRRCRYDRVYRETANRVKP